MVASQLQANWFFYAIENLPNHIELFKRFQSGAWNQQDSWFVLCLSYVDGHDYLLYQEYILYIYAHLINARVWDSYFIDRPATHLPSASQASGCRLQQRWTWVHFCIFISPSLFGHTPGGFLSHHAVADPAAQADILATLSLALVLFTSASRRGCLQAAIECACVSRRHVLVLAVYSLHRLPPFPPPGRSVAPSMLATKHYRFIAHDCLCMQLSLCMQTS